MDAIRTTLQPFTHNLPVPLRDIGISLLGKTCYKTLILDLDLSSAECVKLGVSKGLGIGIVGASSVVKVPQILKLLNSQSAAGVSFLSYLLETAAFTISLAYNVRQGFPFSTYGETALIALQNIVISVLVLHFSGRGATAGVFVAGLAAAGYALASPQIVDSNALTYLQAGAGVLGVASKLPQIYTIWNEGTTGQLSAFAVFNYLAGSLVRIFTTLQEVNDPLILYGFVAGFALNAVQACQMIYHWNSAPTPASNQTLKPSSIAPSASISAKAKSPSTRRRG
ncbi:MAG: hypothetical protein M1829_003623 [Trizodia sp. TS-e1964]|nr:MAG: hypothetical protein M1829_003623 [Trizodia sp. TS-e1964]